MRRNSVLAAAFALFALFATTLAVNKPQSALAQAPKPKPILGKTFLEGMALDEEREPLYKLGGNVHMWILNREGENVWHESFRSDLGGLYRVELKPDVYDIFIATHNNSVGRIRPLRINGVVVKGGKINRLDITMHKGELIEEIGPPVQPTVPAIVISEQFEKMQKQIDDLKREVAALKKK